MAQQVKVPNGVQTLRSTQQEDRLTLSSCPLTFTTMPWHAYTKPDKVPMSKFT